MDRKKDKPRLSIQEFHIDSLSNQRFSLQKSHIFLSIRQKKRHTFSTNNHLKINNPEMTESTERCGINPFFNNSQTFEENKNNVLNLPLIKLKMIQPTQKIQNDQYLSQNYSSTKWSRGTNYKINKNLSNKYHQKMELMKQVKQPIVTQKIFTITHMKNYDLDIIKKQTQSLLKSTYHEKKPFHTSVNLQKYQIFKTPDTRIIPFQLQAKKIKRQHQQVIESTNKQKGITNQTQITKATTLAMIKQYKSRQQILQKVKDKPSGIESYKIQGWQSDLAAHEVFQKNDIN